MVVIQISNTNKRQISLYIDAETIEKAKERLDNISREVEEILRERVVLRNPERFQEIKEAIKDIDKERKDKESNLKELEKEIKGLKERKKQLKKQLENKEREYKNKKLANGEIYDSTFIKDTFTGGHKIKAYYVVNKQECNDCGRVLKSDSLVRFNEKDKFFICSNCYKDVDDIKNYGPKGVLKVEL